MQGIKQTRLAHKAILFHTQSEHVSHADQPLFTHRANKFTPSCACVSHIEWTSLHLRSHAFHTQAKHVCHFVCKRFTSGKNAFIPMPSNSRALSRMKACTFVNLPHDKQLGFRQGVCTPHCNARANLPHCIQYRSDARYKAHAFKTRSSPALNAFVSSAERVRLQR